MFSNRTSVRAILIVLLTLILLYTSFGEKVYNTGAGWDGQLYRTIAQEFSQTISKESYSSYYIQRLAPWAFLNVIYGGLNIDTNNSNLLFGAIALNLFCLLISCIAFFKISNKNNWSIASEIVAFSLLYFSFSILKNTGYYPFLNDSIELSISVWAYYFYISNKSIWLLIVAFISSFVWLQTSFIVILFLMFFPKNEIQVLQNYQQNIIQKFLGFAKFLVPFFYCILAFGLMYYAFIIKGFTYLPVAFTLQKATNVPLLFIGTFVFAFFLFKLVKSLEFDVWEFIKNYFTKNAAIEISKFIGLNLVLILIVKKLSNPLLTIPVSVPDIAARFIGEPIIFPLQFIETNFIYFGVGILLLIFYWKEFVAFVFKKGHGYFFLLCYALLFGTQSESRFLMNLIPFFIFPIVGFMQERNLGLKIALLICTLQLILSRFWFPINTIDIESAYAGDRLGYLNFPAQWYFMNLGPWQSFGSYLFFGIICILVYYFLRSLFIKNKLIGI